MKCFVFFFRSTQSTLSRIFRDAGGQAQLLAAREEAAELRCEKAGGAWPQLELGAMGSQDKCVKDD